MFPIGARVTWDHKYYRSDWVGEVTGHPFARMVEVDGRGAISVALLKEVGGMQKSTLAEVYPNGKSPAEQHQALREEIDGLQTLVALQAEALGEMVPAPTRDELARREQLEDFAEDVVDLLEAYLSAHHGGSRPLLRDHPELRALADLVFEGVQ